jgi:hypothetical protein
MTNEKLFKLMGKIVSVNMQIVGGRDVNGFYIPPCNPYNIAGFCTELKKLIEEYDREMISRTQGLKK